jgi:hypothetical protein
LVRGNVSAEERVSGFRAVSVVSGALLDSP